MGTWGIGPFDSDYALDFAAELDAAEPRKRESVIRDVPIRTVEAG